MRKDEAERAIRLLCHQWRRECGFAELEPLQLSFTRFWCWMKDNHYQYTNFKTQAGADYMAELWFDQEFGITWAR